MEAKRNSLTISDDGTLNVPADILRKYGVKSGDEVEIIEMEHGLVIGISHQIRNPLRENTPIYLLKKN